MISVILGRYSCCGPRGLSRGAACLSERLSWLTACGNTVAQAGGGEMGRQRLAVRCDGVHVVAVSFDAVFFVFHADS